HVPLYVQSGDPVPMGTLGAPPASGAALGALELHGKARIASWPLLRLGAALSVKLPTESDGQFAGPDKVAAGVLALASTAITMRVTLHANGGVVLRPAAEFANIEQKSGIAWGIGGVVRVLYPLAVTGELFGDVIPSGYHAAPLVGEAVGKATA